MWVTPFRRTHCLHLHLCHTNECSVSSEKLGCDCPFLRCKNPQCNIIFRWFRQIFLFLAINIYSLCMLCWPVSWRVPTERNVSSVMVSCLSATVLNFHVFFLFFVIPSHLLFHLPRIGSLTPSVVSQCCNSGSTNTEWNFFDFKSVHRGQQKTRPHEFTMLVTLQIRHADPTGFTIVDKPSHRLQLA